jgi:hypothetical protein
MKTPIWGYVFGRGFWPDLQKLRGADEDVYFSHTPS